MLDIAHSLLADGAHRINSSEQDAAFASAGHEWRQQLDQGYARRSWGMSPADTAGILGVAKRKER